MIVKGRHSILVPMLFACFFSISGKAGEEALKAARSYREANGAAILQGFAELLRLPNVASDLVNIRRNAEYIAAAFEKRGASMRLLELPGAPPVVFGELNAKGASKTLLVYVHYDGQPADPTRWRHAPWEPILYTAAAESGGEARPLPKPGETIDPEWRLYARSAGDDKAPIPAILAALDGLQAAGISPTVNLKFFFEGEEEAGSPHLSQYLETYRELLDGDAWLFCDGPVHQSRKPQIVYGVRGITTMELTVYGANRGLHSGHYGNWAPVPGMKLARLLATMKDDNGNVTIDGFYDSVAIIGPEEKAALAALPPIDDQLREELGMARSDGGNATLAQQLLRPSLTVNGLSSGNVGALARNVIPAAATARLGMRLVKGNDPEAMLDLVEAHIRKQGYHIVREDPDHDTRMKFPNLVKVVRTDKGYPAARTPMSLPLAKQIVDAAALAAGEPPIQMPTLGGSLPLYMFEDILKTPLLVLPVANHDNNQHAPNENLRIANLWYAIDLYAVVFTMPQ